MSKENVISKKEPFARMVKRDHISVGKAWAIRLIAVASVSYTHLTLPTTSRV